MKRGPSLVYGILFCCLCGLLVISLPTSLADPGFQVGLSTANGSAMVPASGFQPTLVFLAFLLVGLTIAGLAFKGLRRYLLLVYLLIILTAILLAIFGRPAEASQTRMDGGADRAESPAASADERPLVDADSILEEGPPDWLAWVLSLGLGLGLASATLAYLRRRAGTERGAIPEPSLAEQARSSLEAMDRAELSYQDAIRQCYAGLLRLAVTEFQLPRPDSATPREHAARLGSRGMDTEALLELISLYEQVRYGQRQPSADAIQRARRALRRLAGEDA